MNDNLICTTFEVFENCVPFYPQEDKHWGADLDVIATEINSLKNSTSVILDAGCGTGWHIKELAQLLPNNILLIGLDYSPRMLDAASSNLNFCKERNNVSLLLGNILRPPIKDGIFDLIICLNNVLGNLLDPEFDPFQSVRIKAIQQLKNLLKQGGKLILSVYDREKLKIDNYGSVFLLDQALSTLETGDYTVRFFNPSGKSKVGVPYYSHWFLPDEVKTLVEKQGFHIKKLLRTENRIILIAQNGK